MHNTYCFLLFLLCSRVFGQTGEFKLVSNVDEFKNQFAIQSQKISTIKSTFTQTKTLAMLTEKIVSTGEFQFKRNDKVRIQYNSPFSYLLILNGDQMFSKDGNKESSINMSSNKMLRQLNKVIVDCIQGSVLLNKDFSSKIYENASTYKLELIPLNKTIKEFFQVISITLEKKDYSVSVIQFNETGGDFTQMNFSNKLFNEPISDEMFTIR